MTHYNEDTVYGKWSLLSHDVNQGVGMTLMVHFHNSVQCLQQQLNKLFLNLFDVKVNDYKIQNNNFTVKVSMDVIIYRKNDNQLAFHNFRQTLSLFVQFQALTTYATQTIASI